jgi:hypothetical protein
MKRLATFFIPEEMIHKYSHTIIKLMKGMLVVRCEQIYHLQGFEYVVVANCFPEVQLGGLPNKYFVDIYMDKLGPVHAMFWAVNDRHVFRRELL